MKMLVLWSTYMVRIELHNKGCDIRIRCDMFKSRLLWLMINIQPNIIIYGIMEKLWYGILESNNLVAFCTKTCCNRKLVLDKGV